MRTHTDRGKHIGVRYTHIHVLHMHSDTGTDTERHMQMYTHIYFHIHTDTDKDTRRKGGQPQAQRDTWSKVIHRPGAGKPRRHLRGQMLNVHILRVR